jgi:predicted small secreted protein
MIYFILTIILLMACNNGTSTGIGKDTIVEIDTARAIQKTVNSKQDSAIEKRGTSNILGVWTNDSIENSTFDLRKDSIFYVDLFATYKYSIIGDSIKIYYRNWTFTGMIHCANDTLTIASNDGATKYWKFKN